MPPTDTDMMHTAMEKRSTRRKTPRSLHKKDNASSVNQEREQQEYREPSSRGASASLHENDDIIIAQQVQVQVVIAIVISGLLID